MPQTYAAWRATYTPGSWVVLAGPSSLVVLQPAPAKMSTLLNSIWDTVLDAESISDLVTKLGAFGLDRMRNFAAFFWDEQGMHSLVRGSVNVVDPLSGQVLNTGEGVVTWNEASIPQRMVRIDMEPVDQDQVLQLPLMVGAATASAIVLDATGTTQVSFPAVGGAAAGEAPVAEHAAPAVPVAAAVVSEAPAPEPVGAEPGPASEPQFEQPAEEHFVGQSEAVDDGALEDSSAGQYGDEDVDPALEQRSYASASPVATEELVEVEDAPSPEQEAFGAEGSQVRVQAGGADPGLAFFGGAPEPEVVAPQPQEFGGPPPAPQPQEFGGRPPAPAPQERGAEDQREPSLPDVGLGGAPVPTAPPSVLPGPGSVPAPPQFQGSPNPPPWQGQSASPAPEQQYDHQQYAQQAPQGQQQYGQPEHYGQEQYGQPAPQWQQPEGQQWQQPQGQPQQWQGQPEPQQWQGQQHHGQQPGQQWGGDQHAQPGPGGQWAGAPAPQAAEDQHDGETVFVTGIAATHKPSAGQRGGDDGLILASMCAAGHPNPPGSQHCRFCPAPVDANNPQLVNRPSLAVLHVSSGESLDVLGPILVGRAPSASGHEPSVTTLKVPSPSSDISRTHVRIAPDGWNLVATDLHSTNGTLVRHAGEGPIRLNPGEGVSISVGDVLDLGDGITIEVAPPA